MKKMLDQKNQKGEAKIRRKTILQRIQDVKKLQTKQNSEGYKEDT